MCNLYRIICWFIISVLCYPTNGNTVVNVQRGFDQKRSENSYEWIGSYTFQNKDDTGTNTARIFVPPSGKRVSALPGLEGSQTSSSNTIISYSKNKPWTPPLRTEAQCSKYLDEIAQLKKTLQEQTDTIKKMSQKSDKPKKQSTRKTSAKDSSKSEKSTQQDVYFSSRRTYDEMMKLFDRTTLTGVDPKIHTNAEYYLHHLKMNLLVLTSHIQDYSKIEACFSTFLSRTQELRDYMSYYYDSCKAHYEQTCNSNALVTYQDGLRELEYMIAECIRQRIQ